MDFFLSTRSISNHDIDEYVHIRRICAVGAGMGAGLLIQLFNMFAPIVSDIIQQHHAATGVMPTNEQQRAIFQASLDSGDAEAAGWFASHLKGQ